MCIEKYVIINSNDTDLQGNALYTATNEFKIDFNLSQQISIPQGKRAMISMVGITFNYNDLDVTSFTPELLYLYIDNFHLQSNVLTASQNVKVHNLLATIPINKTTSGGQTFLPSEGNMKKINLDENANIQHGIITLTDEIGRPIVFNAGEWPIIELKIVIED